jgi:hypothetical protein
MIYDITVNKQLQVETLLFDDKDISDVVAKKTMDIISRCDSNSECWIFWADPEIEHINPITPDIVESIKSQGIKIF